MSLNSEVQLLPRPSFKVLRDGIKQLIGRLIGGSSSSSGGSSSSSSSNSLAWNDVSLNSEVQLLPRPSFRSVTRRY